MNWQELGLPYAPPDGVKITLYKDDNFPSYKLSYYDKPNDFRCGVSISYPLVEYQYEKACYQMIHAIRKHEIEVATNTMSNIRFAEWHAKRHNWSQQTFGSSQDRSSIGPLKHLAKEVEECLVECDRAKRLVEYADCLHLIFDAADRDGFSLEDVLTACEEKLKVNMGRVWPKPSSDEPVEHKRGEHEPGT